MLKIVPARHSPSTSSRTGQGWCVPQTVRRFGGRMMEQQVWCWGRDIEHSDGKLLINFDFERHRDRGVLDRSTCYRLDCDRLHVSLWGFGMCFGNRKFGRLYLDRFDLGPRWAPAESLSLAIHWPHGDSLAAKSGSSEINR